MVVKNTFSKNSILDGQVILIDKPYTWSSFQAVNKLKYFLKKKFDLPKKYKIGHAGTLDPLATGLLIICTGKMTKNILNIQNQTKEYTGKIFLGATTPSYDMETEVNQTYDISHITPQLLESVRQQFLGEIWQKPPIFSAIKKEGKRLYEHARAGESITIEPRKTHIYTFDIEEINLPEISFRISCSKGTYIRSIAHDFGQALQSGGYLSALRRTKIGAFIVEDAHEPNEFIKKLEYENT